VKEYAVCNGKEKLRRGKKKVSKNNLNQRDGYKKRSNLQGFCHYPHRVAHAGHSGCNARLQSTRVQTPLSPLY
jgi:hypothetical protein